MIFLDTNIFLRYFVDDNTEMSKKVEKLFERVVNGNDKYITSSFVIAEIIWVLDKFYKWNKKEICENIELLLNTPNVRIQEKGLLMDAISIFKKQNIDFIDAYNYSLMEKNGLSSIYSYDKDFDNFDNIKRLEP
ncbi:MAG: PIN domain-containing protein [Candidatus Humimicrobiaceae bacterium]